MKVNDETLYQRFFFGSTAGECRDICKKHKMILHFNWSKYDLGVDIMMNDGSAFMSMKQEEKDNIFLIKELSLPDIEDTEKVGKELLKVASLISQKLNINFIMAESIAPESNSIYSDIRLGSDEDYITNMFRSEGFVDFKQTEDGLLMIKYIK